MVAKLRALLWAPVLWFLRGAAWLILHLGPVGAGRAVGPLSFWFLWERITDRYYHVRNVQQGSLLKYTIVAFRGSPTVLDDGTVLERGDPVAELHFDNRALAKRFASSENRLGSESWTWRTVRWSMEDLSYLARSSLLPPSVRALHGVTLLGRGCRRVGFEVRPQPRTPWNDLTRFFMLGLLTIYSPDGRRRMALGEADAYPAEVWMSRCRLQQRYGSRAACLDSTEKKEG